MKISIIFILWQSLFNSGNDGMCCEVIYESFGERERKEKRRKESIIK